MKVPEDNRNFLVGSVVHELIEAWAKAGHPEGYVKADVLSAFQEYLDKNRVVYKALSAETLKEEGVADDKEHLQRQTIIAAGKAESLYRAMGFNTRGVRLETRVDATLPCGAPFMGYIDVDDPSRNYLFDWKMSARADYGYIHQLIGYAYAKAKSSGVRPSGVGFLRPLVEKNAVDITPLDDENYEKLVGELDAMAVALLNAHDYPEVPGGHCYMCNYFRTAHCKSTGMKDSVPGFTLTMVNNQAPKPSLGAPRSPLGRLFD